MGNSLCHSNLSSWELQNTQDQVQVVLRRFLWSRLLHNILSSSAVYVDFLLSLCWCGQGFSWPLLRVKPSLVRGVSVEKGCVCHRDATCPCTECQALGWARSGSNSFVSPFGSCGWSWCLDSVDGQTSASTEVGWREGWVWDKNDWALTLAACYCH